jgi:putative FmdB family regulatory protein
MIYEYKCTECGHKFEVTAKVNDPPPQCPECSGVVKRLLSRFNFRV